MSRRRVVTLVGIFVPILALGLAANEGCASFGEDPDASSTNNPNPNSDATALDDRVAVPEGSTSSGGGPDGASRPVFRCPPPEAPIPNLIWCADFEDGSSTTQFEQDPGSVGEVVAGFEGSGRAFHATVAATLESTSIRVGFPVKWQSLKHVEIESDIYVVSSPNPQGQDLGEFGILGVTRGLSEPNWSAYAFVETTKLHVTSETPTLTGQEATKDLPHSKWLHVRFEIDHVNAKYRFSIGEPGPSSELSKVIDHQPATGAQPNSPNDMQAYIGAQRLNNETPKLEIYYDYAIIRDLP